MTHTLEEFREQQKNQQQLFLAELQNALTQIQLPEHTQQQLQFIVQFMSGYTILEMKWESFLKSLRDSIQAQSTQKIADAIDSLHNMALAVFEE